MDGRKLLPLLIAIFAGGLDCACGAEPDDRRIEAMRRLKGTWNVVSVDMAVGGADDVKRMSVVIHDDKLSIRACPTLAGEIGAHWDSAQDPKQVDFTEQRDGKPSLHRGIYRLDGDKLTLAIGPRDGERPTTFSAPDKPRLLIVLERAKP